MNTGVKILIFVSVVAAVSVGGYLVYKHYNQEGSTRSAKFNRKFNYHR